MRQKGSVEVQFLVVTNNVIRARSNRLKPCQMRTIRWPELQREAQAI